MNRGVLAVAAGVALLAAAFVPAPVSAAKRGDIVPQFKAVDLEGRPVNLGEIVARRRVAVFFWDWRRATSTRAMQALDRLQATYRDKGLDVLAIEGEGTSAEQVAERVEKLRAIGIRQGYTVVPDPGGRIARQFGLTGTPQVFLIDGAGRVYAHFESLRAEEDPVLEKHVRELLRLDDPAAAFRPGGAGGPAGAEARGAVPSAGAAPQVAPAQPAQPAQPVDPKQALLEKYLYFAGYHLNKGEPAKAEEYLRKYLDLAPRDTAVWMRLGEACARQGRYDAAREAWEQVLRLEPGNAEADTAIRRLVRGEY